MASSIIVAVRTAVVAGLAALDALDDVEVGFQYKFGSKRRERLWTRNARFTHAPAAMRAGRNFRNEEGRFEVVLLVEGVGHDAEWSATRALTLGLAVEEYLADRKSNELGVTGLQTLTATGEGSLTEMANDNGTLAELAYPVRYTARLT